MSVIVKGMKMPEKCDVRKYVKWSNLYQTATCILRESESDLVDFSKVHWTERNVICPLVELLKKHGVPAGK